MIWVRSEAKKIKLQNQNALSFLKKNCNSNI